MFDYVFVDVYPEDVPRIEFAELSDVHCFKRFVIPFNKKSIPTYFIVKLLQRKQMDKASFSISSCVQQTDRIGAVLHPHPVHMN